MTKPLLIAALVACGGGSQPASRLPVDLDRRLAPAPAEVARPEVRPWPATRKEAIVDTLHGVEVADPYRWLEDETSPEVQAWMKAQADYARGELAKLPGRAELGERLGQLLYYDALGAPLHRKGRYFYTRKHADKEKLIVYWKQGERGAEQVLLDPNTWSTDGAKSLGTWAVSHDGKLAVYAIKENNSDETTTKVIEVATGKHRTDVIAGTKYTSAASWRPDGKGFYYIWVPPVGGKVTIADRPGFAEVRYHALDADPAADPVLFPATGNAKSFVGGGISKDGRWLWTLVRHGHRSTEIVFKDARKPAAPWTTLIKGVDATFELEIWRDRFYVLTNDGAPRRRIFKIDPRKPERAAWKEIVGESRDGMIEKWAVVGDHLVLTYLRKAANELVVHDLEGKLVRKLDVPVLGTIGAMVGNADEDAGYFSYTSYTQPQVIYKTSIKTGKVTEWSRVKVPADTSIMTVDQVFYPSKDGTQVSMFILRHKDATPNGKQPTLLYGYGGFNQPMLPGFTAARTVWVEQGGMLAIPNLRGGNEYGEDWHRAGTLLEKQNTFDDFIAAAEYLIKEGWTSSEHLAISGGSNGGLLVGAAVTQRPALFTAVVCSVPLLDMLRYHLAGAGKTWIPEYGSAEDPAQFKAIHAYSPYRRAIANGPQRYPTVMFDSADHDDRVDPMHARKLAAVMQANQLAPSPILLRIERNAGHSGADMVKAQVERLTDQMSLLLSLVR
ncbi:MAG: prolyl oligopeptidase family serine peptidase [Kofleriaceae bacterium]